MRLITAFTKLEVDGLRRQNNINIHTRPQFSKNVSNSRRILPDENLISLLTIIMSVGQFTCILLDKHVCGTPH